MFLLRHGQSEFNLHFTRTRRDPGIEDPRLTPDGHDQARRAGRAMASAGIQRILASPYTRTLQTAAEVAAVLGAPVHIAPLARERFAFTCDIGTPRTQLAHAWPEHDFSPIDDIWWPETHEPEHAVVARAEAFRTAMRADQAAAHTLLVSHWGFLLALTGRSIDNGQWISWEPASPPPREIVWY